jgi:hypothetical protein
MRRFALFVFLLCPYEPASSQDVESFGVFGGFNIPITIDKGLEKDPRFLSKFIIKGTPVGFQYGYDKPGLGFVVSPSYLQIGQKYSILNTTGGEVGSRDISMNYFSLPVAIKFHVNDLSFFRLSLVAAIDFCFLVDGKETFTHFPSKLKYPAGVSIPTDPGYAVTYDGVFVPNVVKQVHVSKDKFNTFQMFGAIGVRSDLDLSDKWSVMIDGRANFGLRESRTDEYLNTLSNPTGPPDINGRPGAPDLSGTRRDIFLSVTFGVSRIIKTKTEFKQRHSSPLPKVNYGKPRSAQPKN